MGVKRKSADKPKQLSQERVVDSDEEDTKPVKKVKKAKKEESASEEEGDDSEEEEQGDLEENDDGDKFLRLSNNRRVTVRKFKGATLIDIRETYDKDGKTGLPGKKGISLSADQFAKLKASIGLIDAAIAAL